MAYPNGDHGTWEAGRGSLWVDLTTEQKAALLAKCSEAGYTGLTRQQKLLKLIERERIPQTVAIAVREVHRHDVVGAAGGATFLATLKVVIDTVEDGPQKAALNAVYDFVM